MINKLNLTERSLPNTLEQVERKLSLPSITAYKQEDGSYFITAGPKEGKQALLKLEFKPNGAVIDTSRGENRELSNKVAGTTAEVCGKLQNFSGVYPLNDFKGLLDRLMPLGITVDKIGFAVNENGRNTLARLNWYSNQRITLHYYNNMHRLFIQGKCNPLAESVVKAVEADKALNNSPTC